MDSHSVFSIYRLSKWIIFLSQIMASENVAATLQCVNLYRTAFKSRLRAHGTEFSPRRPFKCSVRMQKLRKIARLVALVISTFYNGL